MYPLEQYRRALSNPKLVLQEINRAYHTRLYRRKTNTNGIDVMGRNWDTLLLMDACRYDTFVDVINLPGDLSRVESRGACTPEFLHGNIAGRQFHDTVYVTANPQYYRNRGVLDAEFHDVVEVWREDGWDEQTRTVLPETVTHYAREAAERYPDKRLLIHYMQPHFPFVESDLAFDKAIPDDPSKNIWNKLMDGEVDVDRETVVEAYRVNLELLQPYLKILLGELNGRTVVTSDHGNLLGDRESPVPIRGWGHPPGIYARQLVSVPWLVHDEGPRRTVTAEAPIANEDEAVDDVVVQERLEDLGYV